MPASLLQLNSTPISLRNRWQRRARFLVPLCLLGLLLPFAMRLLVDFSGYVIWMVDLLSHWQWLWLAGLVVLSVVAGLSNRRWLLCLLAAPLPWLSASASLPQHQISALMLTIASANVNLDNIDIAPLARWLAREKPDVVVVLEVSPEYAAGLEKLADYPFRLIAADYGPFGIALLSRMPLIDAKIMRDAEHIAHIEGQVELGGQRVGIVAFHPMPPRSPEYHAVRNEKLKAFATKARAQGIPSVVAGDMNATPWSTAFMGAERLGWRRATGLAPTWHAAMRGWFGIPIDHVIASPEWALESSGVGPDIGSDHLPVLARLSFAQSQSKDERKLSPSAVRGSAGSPRTAL